MDPIEVMEALGQGRAIIDLATRLALAAQEVVETQNAATVTLAIKVTPVQGNDAAVIATEEIKVSGPKKNPKGAIFFAVGDGFLHKSDPRQVQFGVTQTVDGSAPELRVIDQPAPRVKEAN